ERRSDLLQPQPRRADGARNDVAEHRQREHGDADAAEDHQHRLERVERLPLQAPVALQDQGAHVGHGVFLSREMNAQQVRRKRSRASVRAGSIAYFTSRTSCSSFTACGPSSLASWSWTGAASFMNPVLSTFSKTFTPNVLSLSAESFSSLSAIAGSFFETSSAAACTQP